MRAYAGTGLLFVRRGSSGWRAGGLEPNSELAQLVPCDPQRPGEPGDAPPKGERQQDEQAEREHDDRDVHQDPAHLDERSGTGPLRR